MTCAILVGTCHSKHVHIQYYSIFCACKEALDTNTNTPANRDDADTTRMMLLAYVNGGASECGQLLIASRNEMPGHAHDTRTQSHNMMLPSMFAGARKASAFSRVNHCALTHAITNDTRRRLSSASRVSSVRLSYCTQSTSI